MSNTHVVRLLYTIRQRIIIIIITLFKRMQVQNFCVKLISHKKIIRGYPDPEKMYTKNVYTKVEERKCPDLRYVQMV